MTIDPKMTPEEIAEAAVTIDEYDGTSHEGLVIELCSKTLHDVEVGCYQFSGLPYKKVWPYEEAKKMADIHLSAVRRAIAELASAIIAAHRPKWISIKDRLPDEYVSVLVWCFTGCGPMRLVAYRRGYIFVMPNTRPMQVISINDVTDWQHLPDGGTATVKA